MSARDIYSRLAKGTLPKERTMAFLRHVIETLPPSDPDWTLDRLHIDHQKTLKRYDKYLKNREDGAPRLLYPHIDAAKWFLLQVCPTKMIDGIWLSAIEHCQGPPDVLRLLKKTYNDEMGNGQSHNSHDKIFKDLFESVFNEFRLDMIDDYVTERLIDENAFMAGAIQMALAQCTDELLPEVIGYNLGYEQLPFHILVTCKEFEELGIDPYYFTLHVTIDNFHTGHAAIAIKSVKLYLEHLPEKDRGEALNRIITGYLLSSVGIDTESIMTSYSTKYHLERILQSKCPDSAEIHGSVQVQHAGTSKSLCAVMQQCKTVSLVDVLLQNNMIVFGDEKCPFWIAVQEGGCMFKTFDMDEIDVIHRFIFDGRDDEHIVDFDDYIPNVLKRYASRHNKVILQHPRTGEVKSLTDWVYTSWEDTKECLSTEETLQNTIQSFECGKMKVVNSLVKDPCMKWLKLVYDCRTGSSESKV